MKKILFIIMGVMLGFAAKAQGLSEADSARLMKAIELRKNKQVDKAIVILDSLTQVYPDEIPLWAELNNAYFYNGDYEKVIDLSERLIKEMPDSTDYSRIYSLIISAGGNAYDHLGRTEDAIRMYDFGINRHLDNSGLIYYNKGVVYENNGNFSQALETYIEGMTSEPEWKSNYFGSIRTASALNARAMLILNMVAYLMVNPSEELSKRVGMLTKETLKGLVQETEEGNFNINITSAFDKASTADMFLSIFIAGGLEEMGLENVRTYIDALCSLTELGEIIEHPLLPYLKQLKAEGLDEAFWYYILANEYPIDFQDWSEKNMETLTRLGCFLEANPYADGMQSGILVNPEE